MNREILPPWSEYRRTLGVEDKEEPETFGWMVDTRFATDLTEAKHGLKTIEGGAEFLKTYVGALEGKEHPMIYRIYDSFGRHHSASSASLLANSYKALLNDWDGFVLATKDREKRKVSRYDERQIHYADYDDFLASAMKGGASHAALCDTFRKNFSARYNDERLLEIMNAIRREESDDFLAKSKERAEKRLEEDIETLTFLYRSPIRWFLHPHAVVVSTKHVQKMQLRYPDYSTHIDAVMAALAEWGKKDSTNSPAIFFTVFDVPNITADEIQVMSKMYPDYAEHIERIKRSRATQMKELLSEMCAKAQTVRA